MKFLPPSIALLLAATTLTSLAQTPAAPRMVSRDELRTCMNSEAELAARRQAVTAHGEAMRAEGDAIRAEAAEMAEEQKALEDNAGRIGSEGRRDRFGRKVKAHNARVEAARASAEALRGEMESVNQGLVAYNASCGGISFDRDDKDAILKEREAAAGKK